MFLLAFHIIQYLPQTITINVFPRSVIEVSDPWLIFCVQKLIDFHIHTFSLYYKRKNDSPQILLSLRHLPSDSDFRHPPFLNIIIIIIRACSAHRDATMKQFTFMIMRERNLSLTIAHKTYSCVYSTLTTVCRKCQVWQWEGKNDLICLEGEQNNEIAPPIDAGF